MPSLYRKWRSRSFDDLVGQEHVTRTLKNAVRRQRVAHAYLFTGPRGTGKTSTARILAKAVNCLDPQEGNPCNVCEACNSADEGRALDVIEIDAASNTSVENVRDLRERVAYAAGESQYKVYIVDEVHRLSGAAFDAFLKTLEEPPPHVIFVFASTEPQKVPATIASRCQRFDFRRISSEEALARLQHVSENENLDITEGALRLLALQSGGSLRDALGLLDQVTAYTESRVDEPEARAALGLADPLLIARLTDSLLENEAGKGLSDAGGFVEAGGDPMQLVRQLIEYWRALLMHVTGARQRTLDIDPLLLDRIAGHASRLNERQVLAVLHALTDAEFSSKYNVPASLPLEVGYIQAAVSLRGTPVQLERKAPTEPPRISPAPQQSSSDSSLASATQPPPVRSTAPVSDVPAPASAEPAADSRARDFAPGINGDTWKAIVENVQGQSKSLRALLRDGYLMHVDGGEVTIGFLHDFHANQFADVKKRRVLEEAVSAALGSPHRVRCMKVTREEIEAARGAGIVVEDDGFVEEAAARLRDYHIRQLQNGGS